MGSLKEPTTKTYNFLRILPFYNPWCRLSLFTFNHPLLLENFLSTHTWAILKSFLLFKWVRSKSKNSTEQAWYHQSQTCYFTWTELSPPWRLVIGLPATWGCQDTISESLTGNRNFSRISQLIVSIYINPYVLLCFEFLLYDISFGDFVQNSWCKIFQKRICPEWEWGNFNSWPYLAHSYRIPFDQTAVWADKIIWPFLFWSYSTEPSSVT